MDFINGFFLVNFLPFGILVLIGIILFFSRKFKVEKWHSTLLFIVIVLIVLSAWRIPIIISRRYAMPVLVPGIVISVFVIMLLKDIFQRFRIRHARAAVRLVVAVLLIACLAKALRFQDSKPYLQELPESLQKDFNKSNIENAVVLIFGNPGGNLRFGQNIDVHQLGQQHIKDRFFDSNYQFTKLEESWGLDTLKLKYPYLYLFAVEPLPGNFRADWKKRYKK